MGEAVYSKIAPELIHTAFNKIGHFLRRSPPLRAPPFTNQTFLYFLCFTQLCLVPLLYPEAAFLSCGCQCLRWNDNLHMHTSYPDTPQVLQIHACRYLLGTHLERSLKGKKPNTILPFHFPWLNKRHHSLTENREAQVPKNSHFPLQFIANIWISSTRLSHKICRSSTFYFRHPDL